MFNWFIARREIGPLDRGPINSRRSSRWISTSSLVSSIITRLILPANVLPQSHLVARNAHRLLLARRWFAVESTSSIREILRKFISSNENGFPLRNLPINKSNVSFRASSKSQNILSTAKTSWNFDFTAFTSLTWENKTSSISIVDATMRSTRRIGTFTFKQSHNESNATNYTLQTICTLIIIVLRLCTSTRFRNCSRPARCFTVYLRFLLRAISDRNR